MNVHMFVYNWSPSYPLTTLQYPYGCRINRNLSLQQIQSTIRWAICVGNWNERMYIHAFIQFFCLQKHHFHPRLLISETCCFMTSNKKQVAGMNFLIMYSTSHSHHWKFYKTPPIPFEVSKNKNTVNRASRCWVLPTLVPSSPISRTTRMPFSTVPKHTWWLV